jgi:hypothetical protein
MELKIPAGVRQGSWAVCCNAPELFRSVAVEQFDERLPVLLGGEHGGVDFEFPPQGPVDVRGDVGLVIASHEVADVTADSADVLL